MCFQYENSGTEPQTVLLEPPLLLGGLIPSQTSREEFVPINGPENYGPGIWTNHEDFQISGSLNDLEKPKTLTTSENGPMG
jgi:hypothetical protein